MNPVPASAGGYRSRSASEFILLSCESLQGRSFHAPSDTSPPCQIPSQPYPLLPQKTSVPGGAHSNIKEFKHMVLDWLQIGLADRLSSAASWLRWRVEVRR